MPMTSSNRAVGRMAPRSPTTSRAAPGPRWRSCVRAVTEMSRPTRSSPASVMGTKFRPLPQPMYRPRLSLADLAASMTPRAKPAGGSSRYRPDAYSASQQAAAPVVMTGQPTLRLMAGRGGRAVRRPAAAARPRRPGGLLAPRQPDRTVPRSVGLHHGLPDVDRGGFGVPEHLRELVRVRDRRVADGGGQLVQAFPGLGRRDPERVLELQRADRAGDGDGRRTVQ